MVPRRKHCMTPCQNSAQLTTSTQTKVIPTQCFPKAKGKYFGCHDQLTVVHVPPTSPVQALSYHQWPSCVRVH
eukprot:4435220-Amphidinium_carterae.1